MKYWTFLFVAILATACQGQEMSDLSYCSCDSIEGIQDTSGIKCGRLAVPENHDAPYGKKITLAFVVLKSLGEDVQAAPMILLTGGPGGNSLTSYRINYWKNQEILTDRDIILFDQRGIGLSSALPNIDDGLHKIAASDCGIEKEESLMHALIDSVRTICEEKEIGLQYYNTFQNARDVGLLMTELGYDRYNLYGVSYGTRLARVVMDMFADQIDCAIINSPDLMTGDLLLGRLNSYSLALERIFDYCENEPDCNLRYPELKADYFRAFQELEREPLKIETDDGIYYVNPQDGMYILRRLLYGADSRVLAPLLIYELLNGSQSIAGEVIRNDIGGSNYNYSMWIATERYEKIDPTNTHRVVDSVYASLPLFPSKLGLFTSIYHAGMNLHDASMPDAKREFELCYIPTIVFVNQYDPVTPPENGREYINSLTHAQLFIMDEGGHGGGDMNCKMKVMRNFMQDPAEPLNTSCLNIYEKN